MESTPPEEEKSVFSSLPLAGGAACARHPEAGAVARCLTCGDLLCEACRVHLEGRDYCPAHAAEVTTRLNTPVSWSAADLADLWSRALAYLADGLVISLLSEIVALYILLVIPVSREALVQFYTLSGLSIIVLSSIYCTLLVGTYGQTMGHWLLGLRVLRTNGAPVSYRQAWLRWLGYLICTALAWLGFALALVDARKQGLHDKIADTIVVGPPVSVGTRLRLSFTLLTLLLLGLYATNRLFGIFS